MSIESWAVTLSMSALGAVIVYFITKYVDRNESMKEEEYRKIQKLIETSLANEEAEKKERDNG